MKYLFLSLCFLLSMFNATAQIWQLVKSNSEQWYTNKDGYLKVIFTDSVSVINQDSIFYFPVTLNFKTKDISKFKIPANSHAPWWTGSEMILKPDGTQLFFNTENDTLIFPANKTLNDSWTMVKFTSGNYIKAQIISLDTLTIKGNIDSVKTIQLQFYSKTNIPVATHKLNNQELKISKRNGFVQLLPLFSVIDSPGTWYYEWQTKKYSIETYRLSDIGKRLLRKDVYGFNKGDVFQMIKQLGGYLVKTKILDKTDFGDSIKYKTEIVYEHLVMGYHLDSTIQKDWWIYHANSLFTNYYPEQYYNGGFKEFTYQINSCGLITIKNENQNYGYIDDTLYRNVTFEPVHVSNMYGEHLGLMDSTLVTVEGLYDYHYSLTYTRNNYCNIGFGAYGINVPRKQNSINLFPNPVKSEFSISSTTIINNLKIFDAAGKEVFPNQDKIDSMHIKIDARELVEGLFIVLINNNQSLRFLKIN